MTTIIDSLIVELGLDSSKFTSEQNKAVDALRKFKDTTKQQVDPVQKGFDDLVKTFTALQGRLLQIGGIIAAGIGFNRLVEDATRLNSELGYVSKSLGVSAQELSKWEAAGASVGAQSNDIAASFSSIQKSMAEMQLTGSSQLNAFAYATHQAGQGPAVELYDDKGKWKSPTDILLDISRWAEKQPNKAVASQMIGKLGIGQGMTNMLLLGSDELKKRLNEQAKFAPSDEDIKKFQQLQEAFGNLTTIVGVLERLLASKLAPALTNIINKITEFLRRIGLGENPADVAGDTAAKSGFKELAPNPEKPSLAARAWNWLRGRGFSGNGGGASGGGTSGGSGGGTAAQPGDSTSNAPANGSLAEQRQRLADELKTNPELRDKVLRIMANEQGSHPEGVQGIAESMMNRALVRGTSLEKQARWTSEGGYYENGNMGVGALENERHRQVLERALDNALKGSNIADYATDNSSQGLAAREKANGTFDWRRDLGRPGAQESFFGPATAEPMLARRWQSWRERTEAQEAARKASAKSNAFPSWLPGAEPGSATNDAGASRSFEAWRSLNTGARSSVIRGGSSVSNSSSSQTHIGELNVTVPPGSDPSAYGSGIRQELQRFDNVQQANTGLR